MSSAGHETRTDHDPEAQYRRGIAMVAFDYGSGGGTEMAPAAGWEALPLTGTGAEDVHRLLTGAGAVDHLGGLNRQTKPGDVAELLEALLLEQMGPDDVVCIYVGGHGAVLGDDHFIVGPRTSRKRLSSRTALSAADLGNLLAQSRARRALLLLDACYSGEGANRAAEIFGAITSRMKGPGLAELAVISSSHALDPAFDGAFVEALGRVLRGETSRWTEKDRYIGQAQLFWALEDHLGRGRIESTDHRYPGPVLPNPNANESSPDIELALKTRDHFIRSASSLEIGESRWFFTGRTEILERLAEWLRSGTGMFVVTGPPGSGKSAILGRVALLADPEGRRIVAERDPRFDESAASNPGVGSVTVAIHARDKVLEQVLTEILGGIGARVGLGVDETIEALSEQDDTTTVLLDALDEAKEPLAIAEFLARLAEAGHQVLVGTRPDRARRVGRAGQSTGALLRNLGKVEPEIDLGDEQHRGQTDVADYLARRLADPTEINSYPVDDARQVGVAVAERTGANFLYARLSAQRLLSSPPIPLAPGWEGQIPSVAGDADFAANVEADLARIEDPDERRTTRQLLMAVAFAEGAGVPRYRVWPTMATAITGRTYSDDDVQAALGAAAWYLVESTDGMQTVYRLFHEELIRYFRQVATSEF